MYILVTRNHQDSTWLRFVYTRDFILDRCFSREFTNEIETGKDTFDTITISIAKVVKTEFHRIFFSEEKRKTGYFKAMQKEIY
jgi:hypothetical protein